MNRYITLILCLITGMVARAQRTCVIADMETHVPVRDAVIHTNTNHWARTDYRGYFAMRYSFDSASVYKVGYVKTFIYSKNLPDTVFLLPKSHQLNEVEVYGKDMGKSNAGFFSNAAKQAAKEAPAPGGLQFNALGWMDRRGIRDRKHLKKAQSVISGLDSKDNNDDPVLEAFHQEQAKKAAEQKVKLDALNKARAKQTAELDKKKKEAEKGIANQ